VKPISRDERWAFYVSIRWLTFQVEVEPANIAFINIASSVSSVTMPGRTASAIVSSLPAGQYHWQSRVVDMTSLIASPWQAFGSTGSVDFILVSGVFAPAAVTISPRPAVFVNDNEIPLKVTNSGGTTLQLASSPTIGGFNIGDFTMAL
jgi:hypothetical protein